MIWRQRPPGTQFPSSPSTDYHGCLDALIATIRDMRRSYDQTTSRGLDIDAAELRAAICAGMLFDRWIEVQQEDTHVCPMDVACRPCPPGCLETCRVTDASQIF